MILIIDDDEAVCASLLLLMRKEGLEAAAVHTPAEAQRFLSRQTPGVALLDMNFSAQTTGKEGLELLRTIKKNYPAVAVILITGWATIELAVKGMKLGAWDFIHKPWQNAHLISSIKTILDLQKPKPPFITRKKLDEQYDFGHIVGEDAQLLKVLETIGKVAPTDASVLITGESGTGKELIAEAIHQNSLRAKKPFVKVNLGGVSTSLFESEMFGHVRGAFTDARTDRIGRFETANKGTIFLDEIGDLDAASQVKLLRVLQDRTYEPLGSSRSKTVDIRVVCATNRPLEEMVADRTFREDLFYRINLISVRLPALRERPADIPLLAAFFLKNLSEAYQRPTVISAEALQWLHRASLPGNIRQLKNLVERTMLTSPGEMINVGDLEANYTNPFPKMNAYALPKVGAMTIEEMEAAMIRRAMDLHKNNVARAARAVGLTRSAMYRRLEKFGIDSDEND